MRAVLTIISAGLRKRKWQSGVFAAGCFLDSFFLLGAFVLNFTMESSFYMAYEKLNAPNMSISVQENDVAKEELEIFFNHLSYVQDYKISKCYLASNVNLANRRMDFAFLASNGEMKIKTGDVIVNNAVYDVSAGDEVKISINGRNAILKVDSVVVDAVNSAPDSMIPYLWINESELEKLTKGYDKGSYLIETTAEKSEKTVQRFVSDYEDHFGKSFDGDLISYENIKHSYLFRYEIFSRFILFLCVFLSVIILIMTVLLSQMAVRYDRKKIGILKAVGFTDSHISMDYIGQYLMLAMAAGIMGIFISGILFRAWLGRMFANIDVNLFQIKDLWFYQVMVLLIINTILYFTVRFSIRRIVNMSPIDAINSEEKKNHKIFGDLFLPMPKFLPMNLALLKCVRRSLESLFIFVLTLGMTLLYLISFFIIDGIKNADAHLEDWGLVEMDIYISRKTNADELKSGLLSALDNDPAVDFYYAGLSDNITYRLEGNSLSRNAMGEIYDKKIPEGLKYIFTEGRNPRNYNEAAVGINFARENKLGIGDKVFVARFGKETEYEIVGIYPSFRQYGNSIRFLTDNIQEFFGNRADGYYSVVLKCGEDVNAFAKRMSEEFPDFDFFPMERSTTRSVNMLLPPMAVSMGLFALIYFVILVCMKKIMIMECKRELETYRFIGFNRKKTGAVVRWRFAIPILLGTAIAVPLSIYVVPRALSPLAQQIGLSVLPVYPNMLLVMIALTGIFICCLASDIPCNDPKSSVHPNS